MEDHNNILESNGDEEIGSNKKDYQNLESAKGEMGEVREENERLKFLLARLVKDYQSLQTNFFDILQQEEGEATKSTTIHEESELVVSLSLGISSSIGKPTMEEKENNSINNKTEKREDDHDIEDFNKGLALGLDIKFDPSSSQAEVTKNPSPQNSFDHNEEGKEEEPSEMWPPSKVLKTMKSEASQHTQLKKARVSIRARCDTQTMNDGCQWRKYGQKIAKGNPCPRAYYRCTVSPSCPVRKQVQRCADDISILITTYEGTHNHPLPVSATAMASTTSAAASMLQSPSLSSSQQAGVLVANSSDIAPIINSSAANYNPNALNLSTYQISRPHQFYFPNSSISTLNSHPTITLDLTAPPTSSGLSYIPKYSSSSRNLNFSSSGFSPLQSSMPQSQYWSSYSGGYFNNGSTLNQNRNQLGGYVINSTGKQPFHQPIYMSKSNHTNISQQQSLPDSIIAATKAITTNQKFQSALATALTTGSSSRVRENVKLSGGDVSYTWSQNGMYLNNGQQGNSIIIPPPLAVSKSGSGMSPNRIK